MNKLKFIGVVILSLAVGFVFMNYGNINSHPTINRLIVEEFVNANYRGDMRDFKDYKFELYKPKLKGSYITKTGYFNPSNSEVRYVGDRSVGKNNSIYTEEAREVTPQKWIEHGGYSADVPEVPASLRHFYDPSRKIGDRYLSDDLNSPVMKFMESLLDEPKTDGVDWALGTGGDYGVLEHIYTWEHGKQYMRGALEQSNLDTRNNYMAKAWRSLGETLHMIADNGCPVHVRNDGHPAFLINLFDIVEMFGNPDPYEEQMEVKDISKFDGGSIPFNLRDKFREAKTTRGIAHELAVFTNENFFTNETISGTDWRGNAVIPITNPSYIHKSPKIALSNYDDKYYRRKIGKKEVLLCTDKWFFGEYNIPSRIPHVDEACVESQAKVLIPTIKEAGVNVMKLFIPKLEIKITEIDENGYLSGTIKHKTDKEYTKEIRYNGPVKIMNGHSEIAEINATGGEFSGQIEVDENMKVVAGISFGGISVSSKEFELDLKPEKLGKLSMIEMWIRMEKELEVYNSETGEFKETVDESEVFKPAWHIKNSDNIIFNEGWGSRQILSKVEIGESGTKIYATGTRIVEEESLKSTHEVELLFDNMRDKNIIGFEYKVDGKNFAGNFSTQINVRDVPFRKSKIGAHGKVTGLLKYEFDGDIIPFLKEYEYQATGNWTTKSTKVKPEWSIIIEVVF